MVLLQGCCSSHIYHRYGVELRASGGLDRPDLARDLLAVMRMRLPEAWEMVSGDHPIQALAPAIPELPPGPINNAFIHLRVADWPLDRPSRILKSNCSCGRSHRIIIISARTIDLFTYINSKISEGITIGKYKGQPSVCYDSRNINLNIIRARLIESMSAAHMATMLHTCGGEMSRLYDSIAQNGLAFLVAHEASHAHVPDTSYSQEEFDADNIARATLMHRANYLQAAAISSGAGHKKFQDTDAPLLCLFCGIEMMFHHLDFERAFVRGKTRGDIGETGAPSPQKRFEPISDAISGFVELGLTRDYRIWRLPYLTFWEHLAARLENARE